MNEANELLRRVLQQFEKWHMQAEYDWNAEYDLKKDIENYVANQTTTAKDEPVAWIDPKQIEWLSVKKRGQIYEAGVFNKEYAPNTVPLYLHPQEPKKPMTEEEMMKLILDPERKSLVELIRSVEKHHGIGEKE